MKMQGERLIQASQKDVWSALNDPEVLRQCIPGCEEMRKLSDKEFTARVKAKVGPVGLTMTGDVQLSDLNPPVSYRITGQGKGGAAGFAKGGAAISLKDQGGATLIVYDVDAQVGGKLAQIGNRLIDSTARKMADDFFSRFVSIVESGGMAAGAGTAVDPGGSPEPLAHPVPPPSASASLSAAAARDARLARDSGPSELTTEPTNQSGHLVLWLILAAVALAIVYYLFLRT